MRNINNCYDEASVQMCFFFFFKTTSDLIPLAFDILKKGEDLLFQLWEAYS